MSLGKGWDGYTGELFDREVVQSAQRLVAEIANYAQKKNLVLTEMTPGPASDGSIDIEMGLNQAHLVLTLEPGLERIRLYIEDEHGSLEETLAH